MQAVNRPSATYWFVAILMLAWNLMGVMAYIAQATMTPEALAALPPAERAAYAAIPGWVTVAYAFAVFGGVAGCLLLLVRSRWAPLVLLLSLLGVLAQMSYVVLIAKAYVAYGPRALIMPALVIAGASFLLWFAGRATRRGWLH